MNWTFLLWLCVNLAAVTPLATHYVMPTVTPEKPTPTPTHSDIDVLVEDNYIINTEEQDKIRRFLGEDPSKVKADLPNPEIDNSNEQEGVTENSENEEISAESVKDQIVRTTYGPVQGFREKSGSTVSYFDIPYGKFVNAFETPDVPESWTNPLENTNHTVKCPQIDGGTYKGDTDCLTLSVFTRADIHNASVLFYIHESDFSTGSGDPVIYRPNDLVNRGVVVVLPNYRLGPLGFLCLRNSTAPGNAALKDLNLALEWTRENIRAFGGNPTNVAVSGDGASAALAGYLALAPKSRVSISKVIADSGTVLSHWAIDRNPIDSAEKLADLLRIDTNINTTNEDIFQDVDVENLLRTAEGITLRPCIEQSGEKSFLTATPWKILDSETVNISFIMGTANHAGLLQALEHDEESISELNEHFADFLPNDLIFQSATQMNDIGLNLKAQYFGRDNITLEQAESLSLYHTDASYLGPNLRVARALVEAGACVYFYEFSFVGALNKNLATLVNPPTFGAVRGDIIGYLFPSIVPTAQKDGTNNNEESAEKRIVDLVADLWVNFLKTGEPTAEGIEWQPLNITSDASENYLLIGNETSSVIGVHLDRLRLWSDIYRQHFVDRNAGVWTTSGKFVVAIALVLIGKLSVWTG